MQGVFLFLKNVEKMHKIGLITAEKRHKKGDKKGNTQKALNPAWQAGSSRSQVKIASFVIFGFRGTLATDSIFTPARTRSAIGVYGLSIRIFSCILSYINDFFKKMTTFNVNL